MSDAQYSDFIAYNAQKEIGSASARLTKEENRAHCAKALAMAEKQLPRTPKHALLRGARADANTCLAKLSEEGDAKAAGYRAAAVKDLDALLLAAPNDHDLYARRAAARCAPECDPDGLIKSMFDLEKAVKLQPARKEYQTALAERYRAAGLDKKAEAMEARAAGPEDRSDLKAWVEEKARKYQGDSFMALMLRNDAQATAATAKELVKLCSDVLERVSEPKVKADWFRNRAYARTLPRELTAEERALALEDYGKAIESDPKNAQRYFDRADYYCPSLACPGEAGEKAAADYELAIKYSKKPAEEEQYKKNLAKLRGK
jgi:hypothetical protein